MPDPTPEELASQRPPPSPTTSEKEAFEAKITEQREEIERLKAENEALRKPKPEPKRKHWAERFSPLS